MVERNRTPKKTPTKTPLGERNQEASEPTARRRAANLFSAGMSAAGAGISAMTPRMGQEKPKSRQNLAVPPMAALTGLSHGNGAHLEALAALAAVDDLCELECPDIVRPPTLPASYPAEDERVRPQAGSAPQHPPTYPAQPCVRWCHRSSRLSRARFVRSYIPAH